MKTETPLFQQRNIIFLIAMSLYYIVFHTILGILNFDIIQYTDASWYHTVVIDPLAFDHAIQPVYPLIVFLLKSLLNMFPFISLSDNVFMITVNFFQFFFFMYVISKISSHFFENKIIYSFLLFFMVFNVNYMTFVPRANSLLYAVEFLLAFRLLNNSKFKTLDYVIISVLPLIHKSSLFLIILFFIVELIRERRIIYKYIIASIPTVLYIIAGFFYKHNDLFWWFRGFNDSRYGYTFEGVPFGGLLNILIVNVNKLNFVEISQGLMVLFYILLSLYIVIREFRNKNYISLVFFAPQMMLAATLPPKEIHSVFTYSVLFAIGFLYYNRIFVEKYKYYLVVAFSTMSIIWVIYALGIFHI